MPISPEDIRQRFASYSEGSKETPFDGGGGGPHDPGMEQRIRILEVGAASVLARLDAALPNIATKADVASLSGELRKDLNDQTWKIIAWVSTVGTGLAAAAFIIARYVH